MHLDFSKNEISLQFGGQFTNDSVLDMQDERDYQFIDVGIPYISGYVDKATIDTEDAYLAKVNIMYFECLLEFIA